MEALLTVSLSILRVRVPSVCELWNCDVSAAVGARQPCGNQAR